MKYSWKKMTMEHGDWMKEGINDENFIGHLRGDFGRDGTEFWTSWFDHKPELKQIVFRNELQDVVNDARTDLLKDFGSLRRHRYDGTSMRGWYARECYGFELETEHFFYCLRTIPVRGDYNFYMYCFVK